MTDEELIKALSKGIADVDQQQEAADRIEELVKERDDAEWVEVLRRTYQRAKEAEAKLAKAVEALKGVVPYWDKANPLRLADHHHEGHDCDRCKFDHARAVLDELEKTNG